MIYENKNDFSASDFENASDFDERSAEELYAEFLGKAEKTKDEFIYVYGRYYNVMTRLTGAAKDLFIWLTFRCDVNSGRAFVQSIALREALSDLGITLSTYYKSLNILKEHDVIKGSNATYYINPAYAWKGTADMRAKFMKIYYKL